MLRVALKVFKNPRNRNIMFFTKKHHAIQVFNGIEWETRPREEVLARTLKLLCGTITRKAEAMSFGEFYDIDETHHMSVYFDNIDDPKKADVRCHAFKMVETALWTTHMSRNN